VSTSGHTPCLGCSWCIYRAAFWPPQQLFNSFRTCMLQCKCHVSYRPECMSNRGDSSGTQKRLQQLGYTVLYMSCLQKKLLTDQYHHSTSVQNSLLFQSVLFPTLPTHIHRLLYTYTIIHLYCYTNQCKHCPLLECNILTYAFLHMGQTSTLQSIYEHTPPTQSTQQPHAQHTQSNTPAAYSTCL